MSRRLAVCCARRRRTPAGRGVSSCWDGRGRGQLLIAAPPATSQTDRLGGSPRRWMRHARRSTARHVAFWKVAGSWRFPRSVCDLSRGSDGPQGVESWARGLLAGILFLHTRTVFYLNITSNADGNGKQRHSGSIWLGWVGPGQAARAHEHGATGVAWHFLVSLRFCKKIMS